MGLVSCCASIWATQPRDMLLVQTLDKSAAVVPLFRGSERQA